jgi:hypothetical protein
LEFVLVSDSYVCNQITFGHYLLPNF